MRKWILSLMIPEWAGWDLWRSAAYPPSNHLVRRHWVGNPTFWSMAETVSAAYLRVAYILGIVMLATSEKLATYLDDLGPWAGPMVILMLIGLCLIFGALYVLDFGSTRGSEFFALCKKITQVLQLIPQEFAHCAPEKLQKLARDQLVEAALGILRLQKAPGYVPFTDADGIARGNFKLLYDLFLKGGLASDERGNGYRPFFEEAQRRLNAQA